MPAPVIMVHGAFCGGWVFEAFKAPFEARGHLCLTPDLPGHDRVGSVAGLSMTDYANAIVSQVQGLDEAPILIGHSMGGLAVQLAAAKVPVRALVLLSPSAPWGVSGNSMEDAAQAIGLMSLGAYWTQGVDPDYSIFSTYSAARLPADQRKPTFARMCPESGRALFETMNWWLDPFMTTAVAEPLGSPPTLVIAGGQDQVHPQATVRQSAERCRGDFLLFPEMGHWLTGEPGYQAVAEAALDWLPKAKKAAA